MIFIFIVHYRIMESLHSLQIENYSIDFTTIILIASIVIIAKSITMISSNTIFELFLNLYHDMQLSLI